MRFSALKFFCFFLFLLLNGTSSIAQNTGDAKPWVFWYWMQGGVSKEGITADLEAMKQAGIGGAYLMPIKGPANPPVYTPVTEQLSPRWWEMVKFSLQEADRLGLKIGMHLSDGFALAGGPWISPELSMQKVVSSQITINGNGKAGRITLPRPEAKLDYYKDIAVYAFPSVPGAGISTKTLTPKVTTSTGADASFLVKEGNKEALRSNDPLWIQYEFQKPFTARTVFIQTNGNNVQAHRLLIEASDDGKTFRTVQRLEPPRHGWQDTDADITHSIVPTTARFFRFIYNKAGSEPGSEDLDAAKWKPSLKLVTLELSAEPRVNQFEGKSGAVWRVSKRSTDELLPKDLCVPLSRMINLSDKLNADGTLNWNAPEGKWTIVRIGHTTTGQTNATGGGAKGLECDKFNEQAIKLEFDKWYGEALRQAGPDLAPRVLNTFHVDSWECGSQNWSANFAQEFRMRRGYDLMPYLPVMAGIPVESAEVSEGVLYDVRKTIAELVSDVFYKTLAALAKEKCVRFSAESVAPTMVSDGLLHYKRVDLPMGEFWLNSPTHDKPNDMLDAISGAHIYGKNIIQAEAFTTVRMDWKEHPGMLKTLQDRNYALGINKLTYHVFTHNPWTDRKPGMTLDGVGLYFQRDQTWWKPGRAWVEYAERCQTLLQQGKPVADVAIFTGEELPRRSVLPERLVPVLPGLFGKDVVESEAKRLANEGEPLRQIPSGVSHSANMADPENWVNPLRGYAYDSFNPDVLSSAKVENGNVVFESGASYKILVFPGKLALNPNGDRMSLDVLKKISELVNAGATVLLKDRPVAEPGLKQENSQQYGDLVKDLWEGDFIAVKNDADTVLIKKIGKGRIIRGIYWFESFYNIGIDRDVMVSDSTGNYAKGIAWTHRKTQTGDTYFISNQQPGERTLSFSFRNYSNSIELYDAVSDTRIAVKDFQIKEGRAIFPIKLPANGSVFVKFDFVTKGPKPKKQANWKSYNTKQIVTGNWQVSFDKAYGGPEKPVQFNALTDWTASADSSIKYYSGTANYKTTFKSKVKSKTPVYLDLGKIANIAEVKLNGISCGVAWTAPYRLDISKALKKGNNQLEIEVTNTWANRLIGDQALPENKRITWTTAPYRLEGKPLAESGLLGPVKILVEE